MQKNTILSISSRITYKFIFNYVLLFLATGAVFILLNFISLVIIWNFSSTFTDHSEAQISSVSWLVQTGQPLYHKIEAAERYSLIYGPLLYLIDGVFLKLFGANIFVAKLPISLALILSIVFIFYLLKELSESRTALLGAACISLVLLCFGNAYGNVIFQIRSDSLILMCVSLGTLGVVKRNRLAAPLLCAVVLGVGVNLKFSSILYFLPIFVLLFSQQGIYATLVSVIGAIILSLLPFGLPQISLHNYIRWIHVVSNHGINIQQLQQNFESALYLLLPLAVISLQFFFTNQQEFSKTIKQEKGYLYALLISIAGSIFIAAKPGSGIHHLIPILPLISYLFVMVLAKINSTNKLEFWQSSQKEYIIKLFFICVLYLPIFIFVLINAGMKEVLTVENFYSPASEIITDLHGIVKSYPNQTIEMGYSTNELYPLTYYRPVLVFSGNPYLVDSAALMDMQKSGLDIPFTTLEVLSSCRTKIWLIPKGSSPFQQPSYYPPNTQLFSDEFKKTFFERYELREQTHYFDLWFCKDSDRT
jgi:4-amino-4-deoxy-L-arabinose transferase-like glycosyltransferase